MDRRRILLVVAVLVAAIGAGLVFLYAQGSDNRAETQVQTTQVLIATQQINPGESADKAYADGKITLSAVPTTSVLPGATADGTLFKGQVALVTIYPNEQLLSTKFGSADQVPTTQILVPPKGDGLMAINVADLNRVSPFTEPGSRVAIMVIPPAKSTASRQTSPLDLVSARVLLPDVLVMAVGSTTTAPTTTDANGAPLAAVPTTQLTLAVNQAEAELLGGAIYSPTPPTLFFVLRGDDTKISSDLDLGPGIGG